MCETNFDDDIARRANDCRGLAQRDGVHDQAKPQDCGCEVEDERVDVGAKDDCRGGEAGWLCQLGIVLESVGQSGEQLTPYHVRDSSPGMESGNAVRCHRSVSIVCTALKPIVYKPT